MADISNVSGVRSGTQAFTQAYLSRSVRSTLAKHLPLLYIMLSLDGDKTGMDKIGIPSVGSLISRIPTAKSREKQIYGAEMYQPLIHTTLPKESDGKNIGMRDSMPNVGGSVFAPILVAVMGTAGAAGTIASVTVVYGGQGNSANSTITVTPNVSDTPSTVAVLTPVITNGVVTSVTVTNAGAAYSTAAPTLSMGTGGTSSDQHFARPFVKWVEFADPILIYKKPMRRLKNLMQGASKADKEAAIASLITEATNEARVVHLTRWQKELMGITTSSDVGPTSQSAEVWDHMLSIASASHTTNTYAGVDRSLAANSWWLGNRNTAHKAANLEDLYNQANYTDGCMAIGMGVKLMLCGPSLFPQFVSQALGRGGQVIHDGKLPEMGEFGIGRPILKFNDLYVIYDDFVPDKARTDPRTGSAYTKNAVLALNPDTFTFAFEPEAKFTVDKPFDLTQLPGGNDAWKSQMRTEMLGVCEAPKGNDYFEDVG